MQTPTMTTTQRGTIVHTLNGKYHRLDGPAVIFADGSQWWYLNGKVNREDGPAVIYSNGAQHWYLNDKLHREGGPAILYADGSQSWWLNGKRYLFDNYCNQLNLSEEDIMFLKLKYNTCIVA